MVRSPKNAPAEMSRFVKQKLQAYARTHHVTEKEVIDRAVLAYIDGARPSSLDDAVDLSLYAWKRAEWYRAQCRDLDGILRHAHRLAMELGCLYGWARSFTEWFSARSNPGGAECAATLWPGLDDAKQAITAFTAHYPPSESIYTELMSMRDTREAEYWRRREEQRPEEQRRRREYWRRRTQDPRLWALIDRHVLAEQPSGTTTIEGELGAQSGSNGHRASDVVQWDALEKLN